MIHVISQENMDKVFIQTSISVLKKTILLYFHLKDDKNYVGGFCIKIHFIHLSKR
jgi:exonuclease VII large subunit